MVMPDLAVESPGLWRLIGRINVVLGAFIWTRVVFEVIELTFHSWHRFNHFSVALGIDFLMGILSLWSGAVLLRHEPRAHLTAAVAGGAIYMNALFGLILSFPAFYKGLPRVRSWDSSFATTSASLAAHSVQSAVLMLYWTAVVLIFRSRLEEGRTRQSFLLGFATAASSMAAVQILLRLFS